MYRKSIFAILPALVLSISLCAEAKPRTKKNPIQRLVSAMTQSEERPAWIKLGNHRAEYSGGETFTITTSHPKRQKTIRRYRFTLNGARLIQIRNKDGRIVSYEKMPSAPTRKPGSHTPGQSSRLAANSKAAASSGDDGLEIKHRELPYFVRQQMRREARQPKLQKKKRKRRHSAQKR